MVFSPTESYIKNGVNGVKTKLLERDGEVQLDMWVPSRMFMEKKYGRGNRFSVLAMDEEEEDPNEKNPRQD